MTSKRIQIASDSVCDLPGEIVNALGIGIIPTYVNFGERSLPDDGISLDREQFYRELPAMRDQPTTAAPSPGDAEAFFRDMLESGADHIVSIHVPEKLSGVLNAMRLGANAADGGRIDLVDSQQLTLGMGFQVWVAAELAAANQDLESIREAIEKVRRSTRVYAIIDSLEYLRRSGRVNLLLASVGTLLRIKPIIEVADSEIQLLGRARTWSRAVERLAALTRAQAPLDRLAVLHIDNRPMAERFLESLGDTAPSGALIVEVTPTLGTHIGPGSIGVATLNQKWRQ